MKKITILLILMTAIFAASAQAQTEPVDVAILLQAPNPSAKVGDELTFYVFIDIEKRKEATGVTLTAQLPEGVTPTLAVTGIYGSCGFEGNLITCNFPKLGRVDADALDYNGMVIVKARPIRAGDFNFITSITANEPDQNLSNNSRLATVPVVQPTKSRKRVRMF